MSERLTKRDRYGHAYTNETIYDRGMTSKDGVHFEKHYFENGTSAYDGKPIDRLCDLEDKIEQGKIVELPFGVGDTLYFIDTFDFESCKKKGKNGDVCPHLVAEYGFGYFCDQTICGCKKIDCAEVKEIKITDIKEIFEYWFDFGKTVFLTRDEAERALERSENGKS